MRESSDSTRALAGSPAWPAAGKARRRASAHRRAKGEQLFIIGNHLNLAEAVEGNLDDFNASFRKAIRSEIDTLPEPESFARPELVAELNSKLTARLA